MKRLDLLVLFISTLATISARPPEAYYITTSLDGKNGRELELALAAIIYPHTKVSYDNLWVRFKTTDVLPAEYLVNPAYTDQVYDMYADWRKFPKYHTAHEGVYTSNLHTQTGGFNREHAVPNSWWGGEKESDGGNPIAYTDLHHLVPADGYANQFKGDHPLGEYAAGYSLSWPTETKTIKIDDNTSYTYVEADNTPDHSGSWSHVWSITADANGYGGGDSQVWEPKDEFKGDFARMYLYVVCAYEGKLKWQTNYMFTSDAQQYTTIKPWAQELLLKWHRQDPVSQKELDRNDAVYGIQENRNPFIDYPELVEYIWGNKSADSFDFSTAWCAYDPKPEEPNDPDPNDPTTPTTPKVEPALYFPYVVHVGEAFAAPALRTESDGAITYTSSDTAVAEVDKATGKVTIKGAGIAVITATQAATETYRGATASYMIKVLE